MDMSKGAAVLLAVATFLGACGGGSQPAASGGASNVDVTLTDLKITASSASVSAGTVSFNVTNKGSMAHDLVILKTDLAQDKIPADTKDPSKAQELGSLAATGVIAVSASKTVTRDLAAGNYVLICNEPGHYTAGMHIAFTVK